MEFDHIIIGAGSAGCVLPNQITGAEGNRVLLLEAGPKNTALSLKISAEVLSNFTSTKHNWAYKDPAHKKCLQNPTLDFTI